MLVQNHPVGASIENTGYHICRTYVSSPQYITYYNKIVYYKSSKLAEVPLRNICQRTRGDIDV